MGKSNGKKIEVFLVLQNLVNYRHCEERSNL